MPVCNACARINSPAAVLCAFCSTRLSGPAEPSAAGADSGIDSVSAGNSESGVLTGPDTSSFGSSSFDAPTRSSGRRRPKVPQAEAWKAAIGSKHQAYYLRRFERIASIGGTGGIGVSWHWPAFFATGIWLLYRRMWGWAAVYLLVPPLLALGDGLVATANGPFQITLDWFGGLLLAAYLIAPALLANRLYLRHCNRLIRKVRRDLRQHEYLARIAARGGTSETAASVALVFSGVVAFGVAAGLGLAVYDDYAKREKVVEALRIGAGARAAVASFVGRQGNLPGSFEEAGFRPPPLPAFVSGLRIDARTGTIEIGTRVSNAEIGAIYLVPQADAQRRIVWSCHADRTIEPFTPRSCRDLE